MNVPFLLMDDEAPPGVQLIADRCEHLVGIALRDMQKLLDDRKTSHEEKCKKAAMLVGYAMAIRDIGEETGNAPIAAILNKRLHQIMEGERRICDQPVPWLMR